MAQSKMIISLALVLVLGIFVQGLLVFADIQDSPIKASVEFAEAYYGFDKEGLSDRLCENGKVVDEVKVIDAYIYDAAQAAKARGYNLGIYTKDMLYHVDVDILKETFDTAVVRVVAERKSPIRTFFSKGDIHHVDVEYELVREDGTWKVCGTPFSM